jgi:hypothetical protein
MLVVLPMHLPEALTLDQMIAGPLRCGVPSSFGAMGVDADGARVAVIAYDWPQQWAPRTRQSLERLQFDRLVADLERAGARRYIAAAPGPDPPDLFCERVDGRSIGLELTQLVVEDRVAAAHLFQRMRTAALGARAETFRHLAGHLVYLSFERGSRRPPSSNEEIRRLVRAVSGVRAPEITTFAAAQMPDSLPVELHQVELPFGASATAAPLASDPGTLLYRRTGMDLAMAFSSLVSESTVWAEMQRLLSQHDKPGVDELVVAVGSPIRAGWSFPSDSLIARLIPMAAVNRRLESRAIRVVLVHDWNTRSVYELQPGTLGGREIAARTN